MQNMMQKGDHFRFFACASRHGERQIDGFQGMAYTCNIKEIYEILPFDSAVV